MKKQKVAIIGFGRFGKILAEMLKTKNQFEILITDIVDQHKAPEASGCTWVNREEALDADVIFYAVPISKFENVVKSHAKSFKNKKVKNKLLIDVLSVKTHPKKVFEEYLPKGFEALLTHPMFGPDSVRVNNGFEGLPIVLDKFKTSTENYKTWKNFFTELGLKSIEMTAEEHDEKAAYSQGLTHFIGRVLDEVNMKPTEIDTLGAKKLVEIKEQTCNDTWELFTDLQNYNPFTKEMRIKLGEAYDNLYNKLLPERINKKKIVFGIQGGNGSFNQEAAYDYFARHGIEDFEVKFLFTTENVLRELHAGNIDFGQFAMHNSVGGIVKESVDAISKYKFNIIEEFFIPIRHFMMKRPDASEEKIDTIMTHPQVLKQCQNTLKTKFSHLKLTSGEGDMIDHANVADALAKKELSKNIAVMGPKTIAEIYGLDIIAENLQDDKTNLTSFLVVGR